MRLDQRNGNTLWGDAITLELTQIGDKGHHTKVNAPSGYKKTRVHFVIDVKHDGRHKARLVADGHLTQILLDSVYSFVVSLRGFRLVLFLAELNQDFVGMDMTTMFRYTNNMTKGFLRIRRKRCIGTLIINKLPKIEGTDISRTTSKACQGDTCSIHIIHVVK
jgi:hypothetical protein